VDHRPILIALAAMATWGASPLSAQTPTPMAVPPAVEPAPKPLSFQATAAVTLPGFSYNDYLNTVGWQAQGALILRRGPFNNLRIEGEYNSTGYDGNLTILTGSATLYGGGVGGGRVFTRGNMQTEPYFVVGGYQNKFGSCVNGTCSEISSFQFGTKLGVNAVLGHGKAHPVLDFHWLGTWKKPYATIFAFGAGLRF